MRASAPARAAGWRQRAAAAGRASRFLAATLFSMPLTCAVASASSRFTVLPELLESCGPAARAHHHQQPTPQRTVQHWDGASRRAGPHVGDALLVLLLPLRLVRLDLALGLLLGLTQAVRLGCAAAAQAAQRRRGAVAWQRLRRAATHAAAKSSDDQLPGALAKSSTRG